jgi:alpha-1,3(6)-mannosylglycoprotein beta-1,6-N-acetyl-glucosaminyltransferase
MCAEKMAWMRQHAASSHVCYAECGAQPADDCSLQQYLASVEQWCPPLEDPARAAAAVVPDACLRRLPAYIHSQQQQQQRRHEESTDGGDGQRAVEGGEAGSMLRMAALVDLLRPNVKFAWIVKRLERMAGKWEQAAAAWAAKYPQVWANERRPKRILLHLGLVSDAIGWGIAEGAFTGGPLGELVQWSDLLASLHMLGHSLVVTSEDHHLQTLDDGSGAGAEEDGSVAPKDPCGRLVRDSDVEAAWNAAKNLQQHPPQPQKHLQQPGGSSGTGGFDLVFTDIAGWRQMKMTRLRRLQCRVRLLDSFGTEPEFNWNSALSPWGGERMADLRQFMTMFPHSPDNSFLGFVVDREEHVVSGGGGEERKKRAVVYGKELDMWIGKRALLDAVHVHFDVHATVGSTKEAVVPYASVVPDYVTNHGVIAAPELHKLLGESWLFVGMGFPYEGPAPLEAVADGCVFLNTKFTPAQNRDNTPFFSGKPTRRLVTSQHPYMEDFIGEPHVYTVDIGNAEELKSVLQRIAEAPLPPARLPYEYTPMGMLERVLLQVEHLRTCPEDAGYIWPPMEDMVLRVGKPGLSCKEVCLGEKMVCEPVHLRVVNRILSSGGDGDGGGIGQRGLLSLLQCPEAGATRADWDAAPGFDEESGRCLFMGQEHLLACIGRRDKVRRLCTCRRYRYEQTALSPL